MNFFVSQKFLPLSMNTKHQGLSRAVPSLAETGTSDQHPVSSTLLLPQPSSSSTFSLLPIFLSNQPDHRSTFPLVLCPKSYYIYEYLTLQPTTHASIHPRCALSVERTMNPSATTAGSAAMVGVTIQMSVRAVGSTQCKLYFRDSVALLRLLYALQGSGAKSPSILFARLESQI